VSATYVARTHRATRLTELRSFAAVGPPPQLTLTALLLRQPCMPWEVHLIMKSAQTATLRNEPHRQTAECGARRHCSMLVGSIPAAFDTRVAVADSRRNSGSGFRLCSRRALLLGPVLEEHDLQTSRGAVGRRHTILKRQSQVQNILHNNKDSNLSLMSKGSLVHDRPNLKPAAATPMHRRALPLLQGGMPALTCGPHVARLGTTRLDASTSKTATAALVPAASSTWEWMRPRPAQSEGAWIRLPTGVA